VRKTFQFYELGQEWDRVQIRCWKKVNGSVDLVSLGGHDACSPGRRVFPIRFPLRHYPIRSQAHGARKVFVERRPRFVPDERARGWHVQYDAFPEGASFLRDAATLTPWDPTAIRLELALRHRGIEAAEEALAGVRRALAASEAQVTAAGHDLEEQARELERSRTNRRASYRV
jgi:hypothetical protein